MTGTFSVARWMVKFVSGTFLTRKWLCGMRSKAQVRSIRSTHVGGGGGILWFFLERSEKKNRICLILKVLSF